MIKNNVLSVAAAVLGLSVAGGAGVDVKSPPSVWLSSELVGMKVVSKDGASLGKVEDVVVHPGNRSAYAVLAFGEWHGVGDKLFALPWSVLRTVESDSTKKDSARSLVLPLDRERLKAAPGFNKKRWPDFASAEWTKDVDAYYVGDLNPNTASPAIEAASRTQAHVWRVTELKGTKVLTPDGETLGDIRELAIDSNGRVAYATLSVGGFLGLGDRVVPVPWDLFKFSLEGEKSDKQVITLAITKKQLELAPEFKTDKALRAEMCDPKWVQRVYEHYSCPVYWNRAETSDAGAGSSK
jgi:sporulation protein YlmC with PRC-barrel domain